MKENKSDWRQRVSISKLPKMLLLGILLAVSSLSFAQTNSNGTEPKRARMLLDNNVTIRTGLHDTYLVSIAHFQFSSNQDAAAYFQSREVDYIDFVVVDENTVMMNFDLNNPAVASWTLSDWKQALITRADNCAARVIPSN